MRKVTDPLGRHGAAIVMRTAEGDPEYASDRVPGFRLVVDPETGRLLADEALDDAAKPIRSVAYEAMGWTDALGERP
ncbi:hypothetical protein ACFYSC_26875 [Streptosporangium sp. NPDC004379]|uniref:hypothetical protein n=1 Tax=Streptosporangium sp. NPDC004379 TaxID=3366189 RepID=UPI00369256AA